MSNELKVEIYLKHTCPFCIKALALFDSKDVKYQIYDVGSDRVLYDQMTARVGRISTVPQIFIDGKLYGGCTEVHDLDTQGKLDKILNSS